LKGVGGRVSRNQRRSPRHTGPSPSSKALTIQTISMGYPADSRLDGQVIRWARLSLLENYLHLRFGPRRYQQLCDGFDAGEGMEISMSERGGKADLFFSLSAFPSLTDAVEKSIVEKLGFVPFHFKPRVHSALGDRSVSNPTLTPRTRLARLAAARCGLQVF
jgi:hypothetical protein